MLGLLLVQSEFCSSDLTQLDTDYKLMVDRRGHDQDSDTTPTYDPPSSSLPSLPSSSDSCQVTPHSSSFSSWTKPIQVFFNFI